MAIISLPTGFRPVSFSFGQQRHDMMERSAATGAEAARLFGPPHWQCGVQSADHMTLSEAGTWEAWLLKLRGGVNVAAIYDPVRREPEGTMRGSARLAAAVIAGATSMTMIGGYALTATPQTLKAGDQLQISTGVGTSQMVKVVDDATGTGTGQTANWTDGLGNAATWSGSAVWHDPGTVTVTFEPPTRIAFAVDATVTWDRPLAYYRMQGSHKWQYSTRAYRRAGGFAADFVETFN